MPPKKTRRAPASARRPQVSIEVDDQVAAALDRLTARESARTGTPAGRLKAPVIRAAILAADLAAADPSAPDPARPH